ncbi:ParM/StbA family protein [Paenibacillus donghaensis]|uniref:Actin-like protein N-terminal domain-containing protein n=1 Tax=Paenibacillus donghaensis TaxID=414771 RepID=A0A2Z2KAF0_9BACL|nr:ParM/StbA family protein [Paenibacillus donghaensis]ASA22564.1 hypothetical protein B9T62_18310 [Paenibacillus donghaensis]
MIDNCEIDLGFSWTKGRNGKRSYLQPSIIGESKPMFDMNIKADDYVFDDEMFVGKLALRHSDIKYFSMNNNKAEAKTSDIILKTAIGAISRSNPINLLTGLPLNFYFKQKSEFENKIISLNEVGTYNIRKGKNSNNQIKLIINRCKVVPQGYGIAMDYILNQDGSIEKHRVAKSKILAVDLGFYTLGLLGLDKMEIMKESAGLLLGVENAYKLLQSYLHASIGKSPAKYEMDQHVVSGVYEGMDIKPLINKAFKALAQQIQNEIESLNIRFDHYLIGGGAARFIYNYLNLPNKILFDQLSQIRGYGKIGARIWK